MDGPQLRRLREYHGLTQTEVARAAGMHQSDVSAVESGRKAGVDIRKRVALGIMRATSPSRVVRLHGASMRRFLESQGAHAVRVFGSTARQEDRWDSDLDLVAEFPADTSLFDVVQWEESLRRIAGGVRVDLSPAGRGFDHLGRASSEAVPL